MAKKKKNKNQLKGSVDDNHVRQALEHLGAGETPFPGLNDAEFGVITDRLVGERDGTRLTRLSAKTENSTQLKLVKRAIYKLGQLGVTVDEAAVKSAASGPVGAKLGGGLPGLMAPPRGDATRVFTFALPDKHGTVSWVDAYFAMPQGLYRLTSESMSKDGYMAWARQATRRTSEIFPDLPEKVMMSRAFLNRKQWEIGLTVSRRRYDDKLVDLELARRIGLHRMEPAHPAMDLDLAGASPIPVAEISHGGAYRLQPFRHGATEEKLRQNFKDAGVTPELHRAADSPLRPDIMNWAREWGIDAIAEVLMDLAVYYAEVDQRDVAATFLSTAIASNDAERERQIVDFLVDFVVDRFSRPEAHHVGLGPGPARK